MSAGDATLPLTSRASSLLTFGWGLYLACSWTWCIGMYLPKVLLDRFGWPGFIAFAAPNVIGCVAFGYVIRTRARSEAMVARHSGAMALFSIVTIAYHVLFVSVLIAWLTETASASSGGAGGAAPIGVAIVLGALVVLGSMLRGRGWLVVSVVVYVLSFGLCLWVVLQSPVDHAWRGSEPISGLAWLTLPMILGFLACPYLDPTFHRAIVAAPSRHAFAVFGGAFFVMILFTCFIWPADVRDIAPAAVAHIMAQSVFTCSAHLRELRARGTWPRWMGRLSAWAVVIALGAAVYLFVRDSTTIEAGNRAYLRWLAWYGLAFPVYVLFFIGPGRPLALSRRSLIGCAMVIAALGPVYELAFIRGVTWVTTIPAAAAVLWIAVRWRQKKPPPFARG